MKKIIKEKMSKNVKRFFFTFFLNKGEKNWKKKVNFEVISQI